ncbi:MAG: hypothetical protein RLZZ127_2787, partial [Planctomycetota bacterium]
MTAYDEDMVREFRSEALERLEQVESSLLGIERGDAEAVARAFRALHTIKGNASFVDFVVVNRLAHQLEALLDRVRAGTMAAEQAVVDILLEGTDRLRRLVQAPPAGDGEAI